MGKLKSIAINTQAGHCFEGEEEQMPCCKDINEELKVEEFTTTAFDFDATPDLYPLAIIGLVLSTDIDFILQSEKPVFEYYSPPPPDIDFQVAHQTFLI